MQEGRLRYRGWHRGDHGLSGVQRQISTSYGHHRNQRKAGREGLLLQRAGMHLQKNITCMDQK